MTRRRIFLMGLADGAPFILIIVPFAMLFGVVATNAGLDLIEAMSFSIAVIAGAAQFTAVSLLVDHAPVFMVLAASLAVNLRMAMYSASLVPYLGAAPLWQRSLVSYFLVDQSYACSVARFEQNPGWSVPERLTYFAGCVAAVCPLWYAFTWVGAVAGQAIPESWALDFAVPICFIAMFAPMLRTLPHVAAAVTSVVAALLFAGLPSGFGLIVAGLVAMAVGAEVERRMTA
ncbi:MAG: branched-chain amino acid transporter AzlC [Rhodobacterales bacterium]|nr:MAG: branched-chain amino acid transporter AzlC [Rhodobacterales bacterium]